MSRSLRGSLLHGQKYRTASVGVGHSPCPSHLGSDRSDSQAHAFWAALAYLKLLKVANTWPSGLGSCGKELELNTGAVA